MQQMEITDIILESHIVSDGELTKEQLKEIEKLLENSSDVTLEHIVQVLEKGGHTVFQKHAHCLRINGFNSQVINEENEDYLDSLNELVKGFDKQSTQQPNEQTVL